MIFDEHDYQEALASPELYAWNSVRNGMAGIRGHFLAASMSGEDRAQLWFGRDIHTVVADLLRGLTNISTMSVDEETRESAVRFSSHNVDVLGFYRWAMFGLSTAEQPKFKVPVNNDPQFVEMHKALDTYVKTIFSKADDKATSFFSVYGKGREIGGDMPPANRTLATIMNLYPEYDDDALRRLVLNSYWKKRNLKGATR